MNKNHILFLHIPKTAGSTIQTGFQYISEKNKNIVFTKGAMSGLNDQFAIDYFKGINLNKNLHILKGHFVFSESCKKFNLFSMVRDTIDLFISNLYFFYNQEYLRRNINAENINKIKKKMKLDLKLNTSDLLVIEELLKNNYLNSNIITKTFAGIPFEKHYFVTEDYKLSYEDFLLAQENLKYFTYVGNTDNVKKFLNVFLQYVPVNSFQIKHKRIFKKDEKLINDIKNSISDKINLYNNYDTNLLEEIQRRFN